MKTFAISRFGGADVLEPTELADPQPGPGQVRLRIAAIGINPIDWKIRNGWLQDVVPTTFPAVLGMEAAGTVDAVGEGVDSLAVGDRVVGFTDTGAYAELALARPVALARVPDGLSSEHAVTLPVGAETASRLLAQVPVASGRTVVVNGAAGAVGSALVQLLRRGGATVVGTASEANADYVRSLGGTPVTYGDGVLDRIRQVTPGGVDAVLDTAGRGFAVDAVALVASPDRVITTVDLDAAAMGVQIAVGDPGALSAEAVQPVLELAARGEWVVQVADVLPLHRIADAHRVSEAGHLRGKLVVTVP